MRAALAALLLLAALSGCSGDGGGQGDGAEGSTTSSDGSATMATSPSGGTSAAGGSTTATTTTASASTTTSGAPAGPQTHQRDIQGNAFVDGTFTVRAGDTVRWTQRDSVPHSVTADGGAFDSNPVGCPPVCMVSGQSFAHTFEAAGEFPYHCKVHPSMTGTITVQA